MYIACTDPTRVHARSVKYLHRTRSGGLCVQPSALLQLEPALPIDLLGKDSYQYQINKISAYELELPPFRGIKLFIHQAPAVSVHPLETLHSRPSGSVRRKVPYSASSDFASGIRPSLSCRWNAPRRRCTPRSTPLTEQGLLAITVYQLEDNYLGLLRSNRPRPERNLVAVMNAVRRARPKEVI